MHVYCSGIGGIGLSAYAALQHLAGNIVEGSDKSASIVTADLERMGIRVHVNQDGSKLEKGIDLFVYSEAIPANSPERTRAAELNIPQLSYPAAVAKISEGKKLIAVCGTHGKSSTTAMASRMLTELHTDPTIVVGTRVRELEERNWRQGNSDLFLLEACEYQRSFLNYKPQIIVLTTCDGDHFDYYKNAQEYRSAFIEFVQKLPPTGTLITHLDDPYCAEVAAAARCSVVSADNQPLISVQTPGLHMRRNAQLVLALSEVLQLLKKDAIDALSGYAGSWRRMELRGVFEGKNPVIDDYGHHPVEIRATLQGIREQYPDARIVCVFQPHTHDRTQKLFSDFAASFEDADEVVLTDVYAARSDRDIAQVDINALADAIAENSNCAVTATGSLADTEDALRSGMIMEKDVIVCMGAGDITSLAESLTK